MLSTKHVVWILKSYCPMFKDVWPFLGFFHLSLIFVKFSKIKQLTLKINTDHITQSLQK